jgi:succinate dehydrogenase/fumarate reductase cytochrome b subunit
MNGSSVPSADQEGKSQLHLVVSAFFLSLVITGVMLALLCHCYCGTFGSTIEMATIVSLPGEEGPDQAEEGSPKANAPKEEDKMHVREVEF